MSCYCTYTFPLCKLFVARSPSVQAQYPEAQGHMDLNRTEITLEFKGFGNKTFKMMYLKAHGVTLG